MEEYENFFESIRLSETIQEACFKSGLDLSKVLKVLENGSKGQNEEAVSFWEEYRLNKMFKTEQTSVNWKDLGLD